MSTLTSSAFGGSKAKPKAPPRRRAAPAAVTPTANAPNAPAQESQTGAGSAQESSTREGDTEHETRLTLPPPSPPAVVERSIQLPERLEEDIPQSNAASEVVQANTSERQSTEHHIRADDAAHTRDGAGEGLLQSTSTSVDQEESRVTTRKRGRDTQENIPATTSSKRTKRSSVRSSDHVQAALIQPPPIAVMTQPQVLPAAIATDETPTDGGAASRRALRTPRVTRTTDQTDADQQTAASRTRRKGKTRASVSDNAASVAPENGDEQLADSSAAISTATQPLKRKRASRKKLKSAAIVRDAELATEASNDVAEAAAEDEVGEEPEDKKIDPKSLSMYDLTHGMTTGKVSEREKKMAQIDWSEVRKKRLEEADAIARGDTRKDKDLPGVVPTVEVAEEFGDDEAQNDGPRPEPITRASGGGLRFRIVNGTIVEDADSLTIDRAARLAEAAAQDTEAAIEEENDLTRRLNRTTWINARKRDETERVPLWKAKSGAWSEEETDRFYDALAMFGTDFFVISKLFEGRSRRMIKLKFTREEKLEPARINSALLGKRTSKINLDEYALAIGKDVNDFHKYDSLEHANEVIRESMKDKEDAMRAAVLEDEENNRQREHQRQQREKLRIEAEKKKEERARKKDARRRGDIWGAGTLAAADDDVMDDE